MSTGGGSEDRAADKSEAVLRLLGLARRAGKLEVGFSAVERMAHKRSGAMVLVASDLGPAQRRRIENWPHVTLVTLPVDGEALGEAMGRDRVAVTGLTDAGFKAGIAKLEL